VKRVEQLPRVGHSRCSCDRQGTGGDAIGSRLTPRRRPAIAVQRRHRLQNVLPHLRHRSDPGGVSCHDRAG
jgi:hypothetical protein